MKIVHITPSLAGGGAERMLSKLTYYDDSNDHIIISLLNMKNHYKIKNAQVINLNYENNIMNKIKLIFTLQRILKKIKPDIVQTWSKGNLYGPLLKGIGNHKIISNYRNGYQGTNNKMLIYLYNLFFKRFDAHIFVSQSAILEREERGISLSPQKVIDNGFEIPPTVTTINDGTLRVGHMGRFHSVKNQQLIVDAFKQFSRDKDTVLYLAGKDLNAKTLNFDGISDSQIKLMGEIKNVESFYHNIDVFVLSSYSEGFPNVIGEAMSYGIPVISTDAGESLKIIGNSGFEISSVDDLTQVLNNVYTNRQLLIEKGKRARQRIIQRYDIKNIIRQYQEYYQHITGGLQ